MIEFPENRPRKDNVVYTVVIGNKECINEQPFSSSSDTDFLCFTDQEDASSETWQLVRFERYTFDPERESRRPKIMAHRFLRAYRRSLYIDNSIRLTVDPEQIFRSYSGLDCDLVCFKHHERSCLFDEAEAVICLDYDAEDRVREQIDFYHARGMPRHWGLFAATALLRNHNDPKTVAAMEEWFEHVLRFSRRDQIALPYVARKHALRIGHFEGTLRDNRLMRWPGFPRRDRIPGDFNADTYLWLNPQVAASGMSPQRHYLIVGSKQQLAYKRPRSYLNKLANRYKTDKGTMYYNAHGYAVVYENVLSRMRDSPIVLLELGLLRHDLQARRPEGPYEDVPSLRMWREYLPQARIYGFDIADFSAADVDNNTFIIQGDMGNPSNLQELVDRIANQIDVIIDDASHASHHQQLALAFLFPYLKDSGYYIIEDLNYQPAHLEHDGAPKTKEVLNHYARTGKIRSRYINGARAAYLERHIETVELFDSFDSCSDDLNADALAVIRKRQRGERSTAGSASKKKWRKRLLRKARRRFRGITADFVRRIVISLRGYGNGRTGIIKTVRGALTRGRG